MSISAFGFNWAPTPSAWQQMQNWSARSKAANQQFIDTMSAVSDTFSGALTSQSTGIATLAAQAAVDRLNAEAKAAQEKSLADLNSSSSAPGYPSLSPSIVSSNDSEITLSDGTSIKLNSRVGQTLAGGTRIDLEGGIMTLSNGTQIDLTTGLKKVNITA
jgi:hypothetical protein